MSIGRLKRELDHLLPKKSSERNIYLSSLKEEDPKLLHQLELALLAADSQTTFLRSTLHAVRHSESGMGKPMHLEHGKAVAGRYRIDEELGAGSFARVYSARDEVLDRRVAIKVFEVKNERVYDHVRREAAVLRLLRLPGIVELHDDAREGELAFIVMDRIEGHPFPGLLLPGSWEALSRRIIELLQILARIHWAGVVHCDLKPSNVLVDAEGRLHVLDLGISQGPMLDQDSNPACAESNRDSSVLAGTLGFMAPELYRGASCHPGSDLYAVGIMLQRSMETLELLQGSSINDVVPDFVAETLLPGLLAEDPMDRFQSADRALECLLPEDSDATNGMPEVLEALDPKSLFAGPERLHWIATDASATLLLESVERDRKHRQVLQRWTRAGLGRWEDGKYVITRSALTHLSHRFDVSPSPPGVVDDTGSARAAVEDSVMSSAAVALRAAQDMLEIGRLDEARLFLDQALIALRTQHDSVVSIRAYSLLIQCALAGGTRQSVHRALYELKRVPDSDRIRPFESLARAALIAMDGDVSGCLSLLDRIGRLEDLEADCCSQHIRAFASRCSPDPEIHEKAKADLGAWALASTHPNAKGSERDWAGWFAYFDGDYVQAGRLQEEARDLLRTPIQSLGSAVNAATSYLEGESYDDARRLATWSLKRAEELRHPHYAGRAEWVLRSADYRTATAVPPDLELVDAAAQLEVPHLFGQICLNEAAFAWRGTDLDCAIGLARRAREAFALSGDPAAGFLTQSFLLLLTGDDSPCKSEIESMLAACPGPMLALQALALLSEAGVFRPWAKKSAQGLRGSIPTSLVARREILSLRECASRLS